jgi:hypothetical protein
VACIRRWTRKAPSDALDVLEFSRPEVLTNCNHQSAVLSRSSPAGASGRGARLAAITAGACFMRLERRVFRR